VGPPNGAERALELAYRHLGRRDRTEAQLRAHLDGRGIGAEAVEATLTELREQGYVDDARFARRFAEDRRRLDGWGAERIRRRLLEQGVAESLVAEALPAPDPDASGTDPELVAALEVLASRVREPPCDERTRSRALGLLVRRGYELELAYDAVRCFEAGAHGR
jgi:regulatory protein